MAVVTRITRVSNPRRKTRRKTNASKTGRRKMTAKQIRHFGTRRQKAALKAAAKRKRSGPARKPVSHRKVTRKRVASNPTRRRVTTRSRRKTVSRNAPVRHRVTRRRSNPAPLVLTLGAVNPRKKRSKNPMAKRKARRSSAKATTRRRRRSTRALVAAPHRRRSNPRHYSRHSTRRVVRRSQHNPVGFSGLTGTKATGTFVLGGLLGVTAAKVVPGYFSSIIPASSGIMRVLVTGAAAWLTSMLVKRFSPSLGDGVFFGGMMQTASILLNVLVPSIGSQIGLGAFAPAYFPVPQNPITAGGQQQMAMAAAAAAASQGPGLGRAFRRAF